jgi:hypothetical protein
MEKRDRRDKPYISPKRAAYRAMIAKAKKTTGLWGNGIYDAGLEINYVLPVVRLNEDEDETF